jgi:two-component system, NtrC family, nitrogen regulation response regulator GlnG
VHAELKAQFEHSVLEAALEISQGHRQQAAQRLGLGRNTLTRKLGAKHTRRGETDSD